MPNNANLSIVIPTYNSEVTISHCLQSIINQGIKPGEVIVVDNASTDNTINIVGKYSSLYPFIKWISEPDKGIYDAMNKGINRAQNEWLYFLGSDDSFYAEDVIETIFSGTYSNFDVIYGNVSSEMLGGIYDGQFTIEKLFTKNICHQAIFLKKSIFKLTGLFDTRFKAHADWHHNLKWLCNRRIHKLYVNKIIAHFASGGISSRHKDNLFEHVINWERAKYQKNEISRLNRLRMIKAALKNAVTTGSTKFFLKIVADAPLFIT